MGLLAEAFYDLMGYDKMREPGLEEMDTRGFSEDYVYRLTRRIVDGVGGQVPVTRYRFGRPYATTISEAIRKPFYGPVNPRIRSRCVRDHVVREIRGMRVANMRAVGRRFAIRLRQQDRLVESPHPFAVATIVFVHWHMC
jgi:hypothetical protein